MRIGYAKWWISKDDLMVYLREVEGEKGEKAALRPLPPRLFRRGERCCVHFEAVPSTPNALQSTYQTHRIPNPRHI